MSDNMAMDALIEASAGGAGTIVSKMTTYPFDILKTRLASSDGTKTYRGVIKDLTEKHGIIGLYKGLRPKLLKKITIIENLVIGYLSELFELPIVMPLEAIVSRVQTSKSDSPGFVNTIKSMYKEGGILQFYVALDAYVVGAMMPAIQNTIFDTFKTLFLNAKMKRNPTSTKIPTLQMYQSFLLGTVATSIAATITYPIELCRTVVQSGKISDEKVSKNPSLLNVLLYVYSNEGVLGLFKGLPPNLIQTVLSSAIMLMIKERLQLFTMVIFKKLANRKSKAA